MAFNLMAVAESAFDWPKIQSAYQQTERRFEIFPIADSEFGEAIGISFPMDHFNRQSWLDASAFLQSLADDVQFKLYDMYLGQAVDPFTYVPNGIDVD